VTSLRARSPAHTFLVACEKAIIQDGLDMPGSATDPAGSDLSDFARIVRTLNDLVDEAPPQALVSFYGLLPMAAQLLGLEPTLERRSPYSLLSIVPSLSDARTRFATTLSLDARRVLLDELYAMAAPILLGEEARYVRIAHPKRPMVGLRDGEELKTKLALLRPLVQRLVPNPQRSMAGGPDAAESPVARCAQILHFVRTDDLVREHPFLEGFSEDEIRAWSRESFPTVLEMELSGLLGRSAPVRAWMLVVNATAEHLIGDLDLRLTKIVECVRLAERLEAHVVGMAGLIGSFAAGGRAFVDQFPSLGFTTGHAFTIANLCEIAKSAAARVELELAGATVAVIGAAGSVGSGVAKLLAEHHPRKMILVDVAEHGFLPQLARDIARISASTEVVVSPRIEDANQADLMIVATNQASTFIRADHLKRGAVVIDDSFPKNVPAELLGERDDVVILEGGLVRLPGAIEVATARRLPIISDVPIQRMTDHKEIYGCFAEMLVLVASDHRGNYGIGRADPVLAKEILERARGIGIGLAPPNFAGRPVPDERFLRARSSRSAPK
jgi:fatty aldehyde-generating acyl-ACP reductase